MSWLSEALGIEDENVRRRRRAAATATKTPTTSSVAAEQKRAEATAAAQAAQKEAEAAAQWESGIGSAAQQGQTSAEQYFRNMGVDPAAYSADIANAIASTRSGISKGGDYSGAFSGIGEGVYDQLTNALRTRSGAGLETARSKGPTIANTADDAIIEAILAEQQGGANKFAENMLKRGVITSGGFDAAMADILRQRGTAGGTLGELGETILGGGRESLSNIWNEGASTAGGLKLGQNFDPNTYSTRAQSEFDQFMKGLEGTFKSQAPTNLFDTAGLGNIAGQAQGPQNLAFKPGAGSPYYEEEEEDEEETAVF